VDCIFCQIATGKIPSEIIYQDEEVIAFRDINPQAPSHLLIVPKKHIPSLADLSQAELPLIGSMVAAAHKLAREEGITETGYRLVVNYGEWGGQVVQHLHMHLLGGKRLSDRLG
jgi:histidine triad (HIT) family protein